MPPVVKVDVKGIAELAKAFRELEDIEGSKDLREGLKAAAKIVSEEAKLRANAFSFRAADAIRPGSSSAAAYVVGGKKALPWYGWADFGSRNPVSGQPRSVGPWAHSGKGPKGGRFIYPAIVFKEDEIEDAVGDAIDVATKRLGF